MPGPGHKKSKVKARNVASHLQVAKVSGNVDGRDATLVATRELDASMDPSIISLVKDVNNVEDWKICSDILCDFLEIPGMSNQYLIRCLFLTPSLDLSTRNGLKQIHKNFDEYYRRLQRTYRMGADNDKVAGGIVGIYAKMCADSLLRDKLFKDASECCYHIPSGQQCNYETTDLLSDIVALLSRQNCCHVALQALCSITHHGHRETRMEIAKKTPALLKVLEEHPDDPKISHLLIVTLSHTASAVVSIDTPDPKLLKLVNMPKLVRVMVAHVRRPNASPELIDHALSFLSGATLYCSDIFFAYPTAIDLLVACARSRDLQTRVMGAFGIMRLHVAHHEKDDVSLDHSKLMEVARKRMPDHLTDAIMDRGTFGEMFLTLSASQDFQRAMMRVVKDRDLYQLGLTLAELVLRTEFSVADGAFQFQNPRTGKLENSDVGLPFVRWLDALPLCANAIRKKGIKGEEDLADIIELKFLIKQSRMDEAHAIARKSIQRNPHIGFYYYVLSLGAPKAIGLRWTKKGLMCPNLTDYVRNALHYRAAEHATELGLYMLYESGEGDENWEQGLAFIMSALEDAKAFMDCAAPDCRSMTSVIQLYTLVSFVVKGHEIGSDLKGLKVISRPS